MYAGPGQGSPGPSLPTHQAGFVASNPPPLGVTPPPPHPTQALQDPGRRAAYDRQRALATVAQEVPIHESVELEEMEPGDAEGLPCRCWPCRCGGAYLLLDDDVATASAAAAGDGAPGPLPAELAVPCSTCSLHIRVLLA